MTVRHHGLSRIFSLTGLFSKNFTFYLTCFYCRCRFHFHQIHGDVHFDLILILISYEKCDWLSLFTVSEWITWVLWNSNPVICLIIVSELIKKLPFVINDHLGTAGLRSVQQSFMLWNKPIKGKSSHEKQVLHRFYKTNIHIYTLQYHLKCKTYFQFLIIYCALICL